MIETGDALVIFGTLMTTAAGILKFVPRRNGDSISKAIDEKVDKAIVKQAELCGTKRENIQTLLETKLTTLVVKTSWFGIRTYRPSYVLRVVEIIRMSSTYPRILLIST